MSGSSPQPPYTLIETASGPVWAAQRGEGPDVVLISGLGDTHEIWDEVTPLLTGLRTTCFDNRGVGRTPLGERPPSVPEFASDTVALMDALGIETAHVVGSSMGGAIAQELALAHQERVLSLTLAGTWAQPDQHLSRLLRHMARLQILIEDPRELLEAICLWVYGGPAHADGTVEHLITAMAGTTSPPQPVEVFLQTAQEAMRHDTIARLETLYQPTLVIVGGEDRICPLRLSEQLHTLIRGSRLHVMPGRGHQPFQEDPAAFVTIIREFWETV